MSNLPLRVEEFDHSESESVFHKRTASTRRISKKYRMFVMLAAVSGLMSVLCLASIGAVTLYHGVFGSAELRCMTSTSAAGLDANVGNVHRDCGYVTVTGSVANNLNMKAAGLEAVVELVDASNRTIAVDRSGIAFNSVAPGQTAPFSVMVRDNNSAVGYRVTLQHSDGRSIL